MEKPALSFAEQAARLLDRGLVADRSELMDIQNVVEHNGTMRISVKAVGHENNELFMGIGISDLHWGYFKFSHV
ncbi:MAG: hypothetical protein KKE37_08825 [Verrucomicrobia bacterium]|nr:hypothetical protein [Verrucomicrobiota bacterium]MBU4292165.1 hypothetical protein [Verrucomicrobiota bacterium]MBU4429439.1 hypothetical protein [Verrucomicrobiota bacterium]MCG2681610.1 hypothetical protein [Kiritimatiellia bacterium]